MKGGATAAALALSGPTFPEQVLPPLALCSGRGALLRAGLKLDPAPIRPALLVGSLARFVDPLPLPELAHSSERRPDPQHPGRTLPYYRIAMRQIESQVHRDLKPTRFWSYGAGMPGPRFETRSGQALLVEWVNELPQKHFLPIDPRLHGAGPNQPEVRAVVHVHGGRNPDDCDGYPESWYVPGQSALYRYPNRQEATALWYHDHAMGINRLNIYAGLFGAYFIRDEAEEALKLPAGSLRRSSWSSRSRYTPIKPA